MPAIPHNRKAVSSIAACAAVQACVGIIYAWSALRAEAIAFYGWEPASATLVASCMMLAFVSGNFLGGTLNDRIGPRKVCFIGVFAFGLGILSASFTAPGTGIAAFFTTYAGLGGLGSGIAYGAVLSCIQKWLPHRRGLASGIAASAFGLSTFIFSFVIKWLLGLMDVSRTLRLLSILFLCLGAVACAFIRLPPQEHLDSLPAGRAALAQGGMTLREAMRTLPFWCLFLSIFFYNGAWNMLNPMVRDLGMERGLAAGTATLLLSLTGLFNAAGRLIMATLSDRLGRVNTMYILCAATALCAISLIFARDAASFIAVLLAAFAFGGPAAINPAASTDFFGPEHAGSNYGFIMLALGLSSMAFNFISGRLVELSGGYRLTFIMGAATAIITAGIFIIIGRCANAIGE